MKLVFLGPPGSGKGTQAKLLAEKLAIAHISLGDILRQEARDRSEIGKRAKEFIDAGRLVPDELTIEITRRRIAKPDCERGFILDGFPRTAVQAEALENMGLELDKVVYFRVSEDQAVDRLSGRRSCKACGAVYHIKYNPPGISGKCDIDGGQLYQRKDDEESAIRTRFEIYAEQTKPLVDRYQKAGKLVEIEASGSIDDIFKKLLNMLGHGGN